MHWISSSGCPLGSCYQGNLRCFLPPANSQFAWIWHLGMIFISAAQENILTVRAGARHYMSLCYQSLALDAREAYKHIWEMPWFLYAIRRPLNLSPCSVAGIDMSITGKNLGASGQEGRWGLEAESTLIWHLWGDMLIQTREGESPAKGNCTRCN